MRRLLFTTLGIAATTWCAAAGALSLGPDEFVAAKRLSCVLAQESLGYLSEDEYAEMTHEVLDAYEPAESDVIYAKAIGYFDGLMFGIPERDQAQISARLRSFVDSEACGLVVGVKFDL